MPDIYQGNRRLKNRSYALTTFRLDNPTLKLLMSMTREEMQRWQR